MSGGRDIAKGQQGVKILGVSVGQPKFVHSFLERKREKHSILSQSIPAVENPKAWLLLVMCASTMANQWLRCQRNIRAGLGVFRLILRSTQDYVARVTTSFPFLWAVWNSCRKQVEGGRSLGKLGSDHGARDGQGPIYVF